MAVSAGVNCGFVTVAPTADPAFSQDLLADTRNNANKWVAPQGVTRVTEIGWYCNNATEESNFEVALYAHDAVNDRPGEIIGQSQTNAKGTDAGWKRSTALNIPITPGVTYWIAVQLDDTSTTTNMDREDSGSVSKLDYKASATTQVNPWGTSDNSLNSVEAMYALTDCIVPTPLSTTTWKGIKSYYKMDEASGTVAYDAAGGSEGTISGATVNTAGKINKCYSFDGDDYVSGVYNIPTGSFSISGWFNLSGSGDRVIYGGRNSGDNDPICEVLVTGGKLELRQRTDDGATSGFVTHGTTLSSSTWYHFVATYDSSIGAQKLYLNNGTPATGSFSGTWTNNAVHMGKDDRDGNNFNGLIDELGIWNRALTATEVSNLYNGGDGLPFDNDVLASNTAGTLTDELVYSDDGHRFGQSFRVDSTSTVSKISLEVMREGTAATTAYLYLYPAGTDHLISGTIVGTAYLDVTTVSNSTYGFYDFVFPTPVVLTGGVEYAFHLKIDNSNGVNGLRWKYGKNNDYRYGKGSRGYIAGNTDYTVKSDRFWDGTDQYYRDWDWNFKVYGENTLYEYFRAGNEAGSARGANWLFQTFTPGTTGDASNFVLSKVKLYAQRTGSPGTFTVGLRATSSDLPTGADLATGTINGNNLGTGYAWTEIAMSSYTCVAGTKYALVFSAPSGDGSNLVTLQREDSAGYAGGNGGYSTDSGANWSGETNDFLFEVYGDLTPTQDIRAYYKLDDNAATTTVVDSVAGTYNGTAQVNTSTKTATGKISSALTFNGSSDYIDIQQPLPLGNLPRSINFWMKLDSSAGTGLYVPFKASDGSSNKDFVFALGKGTSGSSPPGATAYYYLRRNTNDQGAGQFLPSEIDNTWAMVTLTYNGVSTGTTLNGGLKFYLNGVQLARYTEIYDVTFDTQAAAQYIGRDGAGYDKFYGLIDEFGIWSRVLTQAEITNLYNSGSGLAYPFTGSAGAYTQTLTDTLNLSDSILKSELRSLSDTLLLGDTLTTLKAKFYTLTDALNLSDTFSSSATFLRTLTDITNLSEILLKSLSRSVIDSINVSDTLLSHGSIHYTSDLTEGLTLSDGATEGRAHLTTLTETLRLNDNWTKPNESVVLVFDNATSSWIEVEGVEYYKVEKRLNQMSKFTMNMPQVEASQKLFVKEFAKVMLFSNNVLILKGRIQKVTYETSESATIEGFGMEATILDKEYRNATRSPNDEDRVQYDNISAQLIAKELLSTNHDGASPWTMTPRSSGLFATDYGLISMRYEYANKLTALGNLSNAISYDWWIDHDPISYTNDYFNMASIKGIQVNPSAYTANTGTFTNVEQSNIQYTTGIVGNYALDFEGQHVLSTNTTGSTDIAFGKATNYNKIAQSFVMPTGYTLTNRIVVYSNNATGTPSRSARVSIQADNAGSPSGTLLGSTTQSYTNWNILNATTGWLTLDTTGLTAGNTYWIVYDVSTAGGDNSNYYSVHYDTSGTTGVLKQYDGSSWNVVSGTLKYQLETAGYISLTNNISLPYQAFSVSWWMKRNTDNYECIFSRAVGNSSGMIEIDQYDRIRFESFTNNVYIDNFETGIDTADNNWHHYVLTSGTSQMALYVDGALKDTGTANTDAVNQVFRYIGCRQGAPNGTYGVAFNGQLDESLFFNKELSSSEISTLATKGNISDGLVARYSFEEGSGTSAYDSSSWDLNRIFTITGNNVNAEGTDYQKDVTNIANYVKIIGYGDGINQLFTSTYNASPIWDTLGADISSSATTIPLTDSSAFAASGTVRIAQEIITYTGNAGNSLTGCTRGTSSTDAKAHRNGCYIEKYASYTSPEANSSLSTNGLMELTLTYRDIRDESTLELVASKELIDRMNPIERITVAPTDPNGVAETLNTGDLITIVDAESSLNSNYRVVAIIYENNYGMLSISLEASNKSLTFIEQMQKEREKNQALQKYMQGSTNIYAVNDSENCDATHPLNVTFYIPPEAIAINHIKANFRLSNFRAYQTANADESAHTHTITITAGAGGDSLDMIGFTGNALKSAFTSGSTPTTNAGSTHTHGITYGIYEETLTSPSVVVAAGVIGGETSVGTYTSDQNDIDITSKISSGWNNVKFTPNKRMRIEADIYIQIFIESK